MYYTILIVVRDASIQRYATVPLRMRARGSRARTVVIVHLAPPVRSYTRAHSTIAILVLITALQNCM